MNVGGFYVRSRTDHWLPSRYQTHGDAAAWEFVASAFPSAEALNGVADDIRRGAAAGRWQRALQFDQIERCAMKQVSMSVPELGLIAGTRAAAGAGLALLLADRLSPEQRRAVGWTLLAVGIATTVPLLAEVFGKRQAT